MTTSGTTLQVTHPVQSVPLERSCVVDRHALRYVCLLVYLLFVPMMGTAQNLRMAVEGSIQLDGVEALPSMVIRALRSDGSLARSISPYPTNPTRFGVRFSTADGFAEGEPIAFRIVVSRRDSFLARIAGPPVVYTPSLPQDLSVNRVLLFRNHPPQIRRSPPDTTIDEMEPFRFKMTAQDVDGDTLVYRFIDAPEGAWIDSRNGFMTWSPTYQQAGVHELVVGVSDGREESFTKAARMTVRNINRPPRITSALTDDEIEEGEQYVLQVEAIDEDRDSLTFYLFEESHKTLLVGHNGVFNWRPDYEAAGSYRFVAVVSDGEFSDTSSSFEVHVLNTNRVPVFETVLTDTIATEGDPWSYAFTAADPDGDTVRFEIELAPDGVEISPDGRVSWTPDFDQAGSYVIIVSASDPASTSESVARVSVLNKNRSPVFVRRESVDIQKMKEVGQGSIVEFSWPAPHDPDTDDTLRYAIRLFGSGIDTSLTGIPDTTMSLFGTGRFQPGRMYNWLVSVTDGYGETFYPDTFTFRIVPRQYVAREIPPPTEVSFSFMLSHSGSVDEGSVTTIQYSLAERCSIRLAVYTMLGDRVSTLEEGEKNTGRYTTYFDASTLSSGIYMFKLEAHPLEGQRIKDFVSTKKMVLVR